MLRPDRSSEFFRGIGWRTEPVRSVEKCFNGFAGSASSALDPGDLPAEGGNGRPELCLSVALTDDEVKQFDALLTHRTKLKKQGTLYRGGERFNALYAVQFGSLKTAVLAEDGREQVIGYHMRGDIIGFDGIDNNQHHAGAIALEDTEVCALPFDSITNLARSIPALQKNLHHVLSMELSRVQSYLGLKLETVSRKFTRLHQDGLIHVQGRSVKLLDPVALKRFVGQCDMTEQMRRSPAGPSMASG